MARPASWTSCTALALWCALSGAPLHAQAATSPLPDPDKKNVHLKGKSAERRAKAQAPKEAEASPKVEAVTVHAAFNSARARIAPNLGAVAYRMGQAQISTTPGGENAAFNQVLLRMPGVVMDSFGEEHVRGEHGGLTYRINGVLLPEGLNGFGQELDTRIIDSVTLMTGTLPAQFGFRTAGIVDVTAKSGNSLNNREISLYGGSYNSFNPSFQV
ncbi:MAG: hypothetical protein ABF513_06720, partial [Acetobacter malorum]